MNKWHHFFNPQFEVRNILNYDTAEGEILPTVIDWQDLKWLTEDPKGFNLVHSPIPLTEEWLLKFGFVPEKMEDGFLSYRLKFVDISMPYFEFTYDYGTESFEVKYVHQLQNLFFALTGTELTLNTKQ